MCCLQRKIVSEMSVIIVKCVRLRLRKCTYALILKVKYKDVVQAKSITAGNQ